MKEPTEEEAKKLAIAACNGLRDQAVQLAKRVQAMSEIGLSCNLIYTVPPKDGVLTQIILVSGPFPPEMMIGLGHYARGMMQDFENDMKKEGQMINLDTGEPNEN